MGRGRKMGRRRGQMYASTNSTHNNTRLSFKIKTLRVPRYKENNNNDVQLYALICANAIQCILAYPNPQIWL